MPPTMWSSCAAWVATVSSSSPDNPSRVLKSCTMSPDSPNDMATSWDMPMAICRISSSCSPDAPVPTMIVSVMASISSPIFSNSARAATPIAATAAPMASLPAPPRYDSMPPVSELPISPPVPNSWPMVEFSASDMLPPAALPPALPASLDASATVDENSSVLGMMLTYATPISAIIPHPRSTNR